MFKSLGPNERAHFFMYLEDCLLWGCGRRVYNATRREAYDYVENHLEPALEHHGEL